MIQRIQSIYFVIVAITSAIICFQPLLIYTNASSDFDLLASGIKDLSAANTFSTLPLFVLSLIALLLVVVSIFLYKKRMLQIRLSIFGLILQLGFYGLLYYMHTQILDKLELTYVSMQFTVALPLINAILLFLAIRAIGKDEALVRSLNRIR